MDRSFLSHESVIAAARKFVCVRLATYENEEEAKFLESVFVGRSGELENTVFAILAPDGDTPLIRSGRGPHRFRSPDDLAREMESVAADYPAAETRKYTSDELPWLQDLRLALNVAACDNLPLVVVTPEIEEATSKALTEEAWSDGFAGKFLYVKVKDRKALADIEGVGAKAQMVILQPDPFGQTGTVLAQVSADPAAASLDETLASALEQHRPVIKEHRDHIREGRRRGVDWETAVPVTDPHVPPPGGRRERARLSP